MKRPRRRRLSVFEDLPFRLRREGVPPQGGRGLCPYDRGHPERSRMVALRVPLFEDSPSLDGPPTRCPVKSTSPGRYAALMRPRG
jgi:hypothetical protein